MPNVAHPLNQTLYLVFQNKSSDVTKRCKTTPPLSCGVEGGGGRGGVIHVTGHLRDGVVRPVAFLPTNNGCTRKIRPRHSVTYNFIDIEITYNFIDIEITYNDQQLKSS